MNFWRGCDGVTDAWAKMDKKKGSKCECKYEEFRWGRAEFSSAAVDSRKCTDDEAHDKQIGWAGVVGEGTVHEWGECDDSTENTNAKDE